VWKGNFPVMGLRHYRPGLALIAIERASGDSRDLCVVDDSHAVENERHFAADQSYVEGLPFAGLLGGIARRRDEAVDAADSMALRFFSEVVLNLNLVTASQIDAAVTLVSHLELEVQLEVGGLLLGDYVRAVRCVLHYAIHDAPRPLFLHVADFPSGQIASAEKRYRLAPMRRRFAFEFRRANRAPLQRFSRGVKRCSLETLANEISFKRQSRSLPL